MIVGMAKQFQLYDEIVMRNEKISIEAMILKAAKKLYPYVAKENNIVILVGRGNNGADGLALSCLLKNMEQDVTVFLMTEKSALSEGASFYLEKALTLGVPVYYLSEAKDFGRSIFEDKVQIASVIIDAIFGTGLHSAPRGVEKEIIHYINTQNKAPVLAIDVPSGLNADNGIAYNEAIRAHLTITFVANKLGYLNPDSLLYTGEIHVEDLDYPPEFMSEAGFSHLLEPQMIEKMLKPRRFDGHKMLYGQLACWVGSEQYLGAAVLSCGAALKTGTGIVKVISSESVSRQVVNAYPEIVRSDPDLSLNEQLKNISAVLFGCGKGHREETTDQLKALLSFARVPVLLDADGINCLADHLEFLHQANCPIILTPHFGEMKRLLGNTQNQDPVLGAIHFARQYRVIIVLKGPYTMITDGKMAVRIPSGHKAMSTAGMGDALAGMISSFLSQGYAYMDACILGTYLHGLCGSYLAKENYSVFASDLISLIPKMMARILTK